VMDSYQRYHTVIISTINFLEIMGSFLERYVQLLDGAILALPGRAVHLHLARLRGARGGANLSEGTYSGEIYSAFGDWCYTQLWPVASSLKDSIP
jgi:hypothetical protein